MTDRMTLELALSRLRSFARPRANIPDYGDENGSDENGEDRAKEAARFIVNAGKRARGEPVDDESTLDSIAAKASGSSAAVAKLLAASARLQTRGFRG